MAENSKVNWLSSSAQMEEILQANRNALEWCNGTGERRYNGYVLFTLKLNSLYLIYIALLGCSLYALIGGFLTTNMDEIRKCFAEKFPINALSLYLAVFAILFYLLWLSELVPALLAGKLPQSMQDQGTARNAVYVLDMAWVLPALVITAVGLRRNQTFAYTLAGTILSYPVLMILAILGMATQLPSQWAQFSGRSLQPASACSFGL